MAHRFRTLLFVSLFATTGCAGVNASSASKVGLAVLDYNVDKAAEEYAEQKSDRMEMCDQMELKSKEEAISCMGPYHGDDLERKIELIVTAQEAMLGAIKAYEELSEILGEANEQ